MSVGMMPVRSRFDEPRFRLCARRHCVASARYVQIHRIDQLASGQLAQPACRPAAQVRRSGRAGARGGRLEPAAAAGRVLGSRGAARQARAGAARRAVPAAGRRLRRELRGLRVGQHRQAPEDPAADEPGAAAGLEEAHHSRGPLRRSVRQAALGRHRDPRRRHPAHAIAATTSIGPASAPPSASRTRSCCCAATSAPRSP